MLVTVAMVAALVVVGVAPGPAGAAGTVLFQNIFNDRTVDGTGTVTVPATTSGANAACLTASGNTTTPPVLSCSGSGDAQGSGKLRLTNASTNQVGAVFGLSSFPTSNGLDVTFNSYQWGGGSADGMAFVLAAVDPANPTAPALTGPTGGALGYSTGPGVNGLANAYLGVGLDVFGNFSSNTYSGSGCTNPANISVQTAGAVVVRGPGNAKVGYCGLTTTSDGTLASKTILRAATRAASVVPVQVLINPTVAAFTSDSGVTVDPGTYKVVVKPVGQPTKTLTGNLPSVPSTLYPSTSWLNANGVPKQLVFGFVGSTGSVTDVHEASDTKVLTFNPVPQLAVVSTSYAAATLVAGDPVNYTDVASVLTGADVATPISLTETVPAGVLALGAFGAGWICQAPIGRSVTCTTAASSFNHGTTLPPITVVAVVTGSGLTSTVIETSSLARASSADANPGTDAVTTHGSVPSAPTGVVANPAIGPIAGGGTVIVGATTVVAPTAVEIGTVAEQQAGTPVVLLPCTAGRAVGCFNIEGSSLAIVSMPARATSAAVSITVVTLGVATATGYTYADKPATIATPTATAGTTSATLTWIAPAANGSALTGYTVTPYLAGVAQAPQSFDTSTTTRTFTGLTAGGSYAFTVAATNAFGTSVPSAKSAAVVPYTLPGAPTISAASAGDSSATLTWNNPFTGFTPITAFVVTPYIGAVALAVQTFGGSGTTQVVTGLTPGTAYTFTVAAQNAAGTGPASVRSAAVTPNVSPSLTFAAPPAGEVGVAYGRLLTVTDGTAPFVWTVSSGSLPAGLSLNASTGSLSGTPTNAGTFAFTVQVVDASSQTATKAVTLTIAAAPTLAFTPAPGEVGIAYSQAPNLSGGTGPFVWTVSAGGLPAGVVLDAGTGLVSGTPTASGNFSVTVTATDSFNQAASRTVVLVIVARPSFAPAAPPAGQVGVAYSTTLAVTGGTLPLTWSITIGTVPPGLALAPGTGVLSATPTTEGSYTFTAFVVDAKGVSATKAITLVIAPGPLVIVKTANATTVVAGGTVAYTITVTNTGPTIWTGATLNDPLSGVLDDAVYNANATATTGALSYTAPTLGWTGSIAANATVTINYTVTVNNPDIGNKLLTNTVTSATLGANCATGSTDTRCSTIVTVLGLSIVKTADVATTTPGGTIHVSIVVTNTGQAAYVAASLTDSLAGMLDDGVYNADATATAGSVSYTSASLTWTGDLAIGASATITYSVTVANPDLGNRALTGTIVSSTPGSPCPAASPAASCTVNVTVLVPALVITTTTDVTTTKPGRTVAYTMNLTNTGQTAYTATSATLALAGVVDDATYNADATATAGSVAYDGGAKTLTWTGNLAIGATVTVTATVTVHNPDLADLVLATATTSPAAGSSCPVEGSSPACFTAVAVRVPQLTITTAANAATTTPGSTVRYTVSVTNTGQTPYTAATASAAAVTVPLTGVLDDAVYNTDAATTTGAVAYAAPSLSWTGDLLIGATATITFSVTVHDPDSGNRVLTATVSSPSEGSTCPTAGTDPVCTTTVTVLVPGLSFATGVDVATATPGQVVHYTATVTNTGQTTYTGLAVTLDLADALDDASYNYDATITTGNLVTNPDGTVDWVLDLAPGASATGTISVTVNDPATGNRSLRIVAVANAPGSMCPTGATAAACVVTATVLVPGLTITKTAAASTVVTGGTTAYTITVVNNGQTPYAPAVLTDDLSGVLTDATYAGGATASSGTVSYVAPVLSWSGALAPGVSASITYSVTIRDPDPGDKVMTNTVVSSSAGSNCPAAGTDPRCTATVQIRVPGLTIAKVATVATTAPGATVAYTVTITNSGATSFVGATVSDSLAGVLDDAAYDNNAAVDIGTAGLSGSVLTWTGDLAIGATATLTYSVTVHPADGGDNLLIDVVSSAASGNNCTVGSVDARCTSTVPVARLVLAYGAVAPTITPGGTVHFTATFTNTGQVPYVDISVASLAPSAADDALPGGDQTATSGSFVLGVSGITWTGNIPIGGAVSLTANMTVANPDLGDRVIIVTTESSAPGNNCPPSSTDPRCTVRIDVVVPALTIVKTAGTTATVPGGTVGYTITVHNTGQTAYVGAIVTDALSGVLDDATYDANVTTTSGTMSYAAPTLTWTGDLAVGDTATIAYSVTVHSVETGDKTMVNPVASTEVGSTCPPASGNAACRTTVVVLTPALTIVKTANLANATLGTTVTYTVKVTNSGQTSYAAAAFSDPLTGVLDDATYNAGSAAASSGSVSFAGDVLSWSGALSPGVTATITYSVTIDNPDTGDRTMTNTVASASAGSNCASGSSDVRCTATVAVTDAVSLTFTKTADVAAAIADGLVHYTVTIVNATGSDVTAVDMTDPLAGVIDDAAFNADAAATAGTVTWTSPNLTWLGTVPAGGTVTITYSVTVDATPSGDQVLQGTVRSDALPGSNNCAAASTDPRCTNTVTVASLVIEQHYTETSTTPGSLVHLTGTFTNTGATPYTGITISSPSAGTVDDAIPTGDQVATSGVLVLSAAAITWSGNIPVGGTVTVTGTLTVKNPDPGDRSIAGTLVSSALGNNCTSGSGDARCAVALPVLLPGLTITKTADTTYVVPGGRASYTIVVHNSGETPYVGATVSDTLTGVLDDATYNGDVTTTSGSMSFVTPVLTWTGDLAVGASATITYSATAYSPAIGDKTMLNAASSGVVGSTCPTASGNPACRSTVAVLTPSLVITSSASVASSLPGGVVTYTVVATNSGQTPYFGATITVPLAGVLDDATYSGGVSATTGTVGVTGGLLTWTGLLVPTDVVTITYAVTVDQPVTGDFHLAQTVTSAEQGSSCPAVGPDPQCTTSVPIATLRIANTADVATTTPTAIVHYTVTFTNAGQVPYVGISITDSFVGSLDDAAYNGDAATTGGSLILDPLTGRVIWTGDLAPGAVVTVTGSVTVNNPDLGDKAMSTVITTDAVASNCPTGSVDAGCRSDVAVLTPALLVTIVADTTVTAPSGTVGYTITATNTGEVAYASATVRNSLAGVLNDSTYNGNAVATRGAVTFTSPTLTWTGALAVGESAVITYTVGVNNPDLGDKLMVDTVTSDDLGSTCPTGGSAPACTAFVVVLVPVLAIAIVADHTTIEPGQTAAYTVTIHNMGQSDYIAATVTIGLGAVLDDAAYAGNAVATAGSVAYTAPDLHWTGDVAVGSTATVTFSVMVSDPDTGDRSLSAAVSSSAPGSTCTGTLPCVDVITVLVPGLAVATTADRVTATPGDAVVFTITMSNTGPTTYDAASVATSLSAILDDATFDGTITATSGVATYAVPDLAWTGTLHPGDVATITYRVVVADPDTGDKVLTTTVHAPMAGSTCPASGGGAACTASVSVLVPQLTLTVAADAPTTTPGATVGYTVLITNTGETSYVGAIVDVSLAGTEPDAVYNGDAATTGGGTLGYTPPTLSWTGDLAGGATASIRFSVTVHDPDPGDKFMVVTVVSAAPGSTCPAGNALAACAADVRVLVPALVITKTADRTSVTAGGVVTYTVTLANTGETAYAPAAFTDPLAGVLDDATYAGDATATAGAVTYANGILDWSGALAVAQTATVTYSVTTTYPAVGDRGLNNAVHSGSAGANCPSGTPTDLRCTSTVTVLVPALQIVKTANTTEVVAGGSVQYTVSATNTGQADYPTLTLTDSLAGVLDDATSNADAAATSGSVTDTTGTITWTGALATGATVVITYSVTVDLTGTGDGVLTNRVVSAAVGSTCTAGSADPGCVTSTTVAARFITMTGISPSFVLSGLPHTTVTADGAVTMTITTNSAGGYVLSVQATTATLTGAAPGNAETIPVDQLGVRESGTAIFQPLSTSVPVVVHTQSGPSQPEGDAVSNDYQVHIPFVAPDSYSTTLDYIVSAQ